MEDMILINNTNIANYVMFKLDKLENAFTEEELLSITELVIDYNEEEDSSFSFLEELLKFKNLKSVTLKNGYIYNDNYNIFLNIASLNEITFINCEFEDADLISSLNITELSLKNCKINNYSFIYIMNNLKRLTIINGEVKISNINMLNSLIYLQISYSKILDVDNLIDINNLEELYIDNTAISDLSFINTLTNLKILSIDDKQKEKNKDLLVSLDGKISILNEGMGRLEVSSDEL